MVHYPCMDAANDHGSGAQHNVVLVCGMLMV